MAAFCCSWRPQISDSEETEEGRNIKVKEMVGMNECLCVCLFFYSIFQLMLNSFYQNNMLGIISHLYFCFCFQFGMARRASRAAHQRLKVERESCLNGRIQASDTRQAKTASLPIGICLIRVCSCASRNIRPT